MRYKKRLKDPNFDSQEVLEDVILDGREFFFCGGGVKGGGLGRVRSRSFFFDILGWQILAALG